MASVLPFDELNRFNEQIRQRYREKLVMDDGFEDVIDMMLDLFKSKAGGVELLTKTDALAEGQTHEGERCKIIIGRTNYAQSETAYDTLMYQDFRIIAEDTNIVVAAYTNTGYSPSAATF